jgi:hypothetical protein
MSKIIIDIRDDIDPTAALLYVGHVIHQGRISKNNTKYCWITVFHDGVQVIARDNRKSDSFVVLKDKSRQHVN